MTPQLTFDDVLIVPHKSNLSSRSEVDLSSSLTDDKITNLPIMSAAMDTVTGMDMQKFMRHHGMGIHHRYCSHDHLLAMSYFGAIAVSPSMGIDFLTRLLYEGFKGGYTPIVALDVAHGHSRHALKYAEEAVARDMIVISGNIVTVQAAQDYINCGVNILKVGIGGGSACSTRQIAGVGFPQWSAVGYIYQMTQNNPDVRILSDGGHKTSGDIVKALAAGADYVILGGMLAGTDRCPGEVKYNQNGDMVMEFRGMASEEALISAEKEVNPEGVAAEIPYKGKTIDILKGIESGLRAGFAYLGAKNIQQLRQNAEWIRITENGVREGMPRI